MTDAFPKIWNTTFTDHTANFRNIDFHIVDSSVKREAASSRSFLYSGGTPLQPDLVPDSIFFSLRDRIKDNKNTTPDLVMISGGVPVISEKFRDLLAALTWAPR